MKVRLKDCSKGWYNKYFYIILEYKTNHKVFEVQRWKDNKYIFTIRRHSKYFKKGTFNSDEHILTPKELKVLKQMLDLYIYHIEIPQLLS